MWNAWFVSSSRDPGGADVWPATMARVPLTRQNGGFQLPMQSGYFAGVRGRLAGRIARRSVLLFGGVALVLVAGCGGSGLKVSYDYDPQADFARLRTWNWVAEEQRPTGDARVDDPLVDRRIRSAIQDELQRRGYERTADNPDMLIAYHAAIDDKIDITEVNNYYGYSYYTGYPHGWKGTEYTYDAKHEWNEGTLVIDVLSTREKMLVWRANAHAEVHLDADVSERDKRIREAVASMLDSFPPEAKR
jgi:hypothetical protein